MFHMKELETSLNMLMRLRQIACGLLLALLIPPLSGAGAEGLPSKRKAFFLSLAVPGAGEHYAGSRKAATFFFGTECALWAAFAGFRSYGLSWEHDYREYAVAHAGVVPFGKDHEFFAAIENYMNITDYNDAKLQQRNLRALYPEGGGYDWQWDGAESRRRFELMRIRADRARRNSTFMLGGIVLNHIVSGIDAIRAARKAGKRDGEGVQVGVAGLPEGGGRVWLVKRF
jgi:hypothetical protein